LRNKKTLKILAALLAVSILLRGNGVAQLGLALALAVILALFQSSCEATGLRNGDIGMKKVNAILVSILLRGNGVAQRFIALAIDTGQWKVSILLRGNGVAQR